MRSHAHADHRRRDQAVAHVARHDAGAARRSVRRVGAHGPGMGGRRAGPARARPGRDRWRDTITSHGAGVGLAREVSMSIDRSIAVPGWWRRHGGGAPGQTGRHLTHGPELPPPPPLLTTPPAVVDMAPSSSDVSRSQPDRWAGTALIQGDATRGTGRDQQRARCCGRGAGKHGPALRPGFSVRTR